MISVFEKLNFMAIKKPLIKKYLVGKFQYIFSRNKTKFVISQTTCVSDPLVIKEWPVRLKTIPCRTFMGGMRNFGNEATFENN